MTESNCTTDLHCNCKVSDNEKKRIVNHFGLVTILACESCIRRFKL